MEHSAHDRAQYRFIPAIIRPSIFVLISPVSILGAVKAGKFGEERLPRVLTEVLRLLDIEIVETVAVHIMPPALEILRLKRVAVVGKRSRFAGVRQQFFRRSAARSAELEEESNDVAALPGRHRLRQAVRHQRANVRSFLDLGLGNVDKVSRWRVFEDERLVVFAFLVARVYPPSTSHHGNGHIPFLELPLGPKDRFYNLTPPHPSPSQPPIRTPPPPFLSTLFPA